MARSEKQKQKDKEKNTEYLIKYIKRLTEGKKIDKTVLIFVIVNCINELLKKEKDMDLCKEILSNAMMTFLEKYAKLNEEDLMLLSPLIVPLVNELVDAAVIVNSRFKELMVKCFSCKTTQ